MPDLRAAAEQLAREIMADDVSALLPRFTPAGLGKAMALLDSDGSTGASEATRFEIDDRGEGVLHIIFLASDGQGGIFTRWLELDGAWKVDDIGLLDEIDV